MICCADILWKMVLIFLSDKGCTVAGSSFSLVVYMGNSVVIIC